MKLAFSWTILQTPTLHAGWLISKLIEFYWFAAICMECTLLVWRNVIITLKPRKWQERLKYKCIPHLSNLRNDNLIQSRFENINAPVENYVNISFSWFAVNQLLFLPTFYLYFATESLYHHHSLKLKKLKSRKTVLKWICAWSRGHHKIPKMLMLTNKI